jgi:hypothetical protein
MLYVLQKPLAPFLEIFDEPLAKPGGGIKRRMENDSRYGIQLVGDDSVTEA